MPANSMALASFNPSIPVCRERVVSVQRQDDPAACVFANQTKLLLSRFLAKSVAVGDEVTFPIPAPDAVGSEILVTKNATPGPGRYIYQAPIGHVSHPKQDKRNQYFVSAEVRGGSLGISTVFLPCEVLREYFYRVTPTANRVDHPTLYENLRIPASASPSELRVAFKLRDLELKTAWVPHSQRVALERAFNIVGQPELRACYDALLTDPEAPALFPYGGFGSLFVAGEPSRDGETFFARRILAFSPDLRHRRFHVPLRKCDFYDDRALCRDMRRKLEFWLDPAGLAYTLGPHMESVEASAGSQDRGRGYVRTARQVPQASWRSGISLPGKLRCRAGWRSNCRPISICNWSLPKLPIIASASIRGLWIRSGCAWSVGRSSERSCSECVRNCVFRVTLMSPRSAGALIMTRSSIASSHAGHAGSICFGMNTSSTLRKPWSSKPLSLATRLTSLPSLGTWIPFSLCTPRSRRTTSGETAIMQPSD